MKRFLFVATCLGVLSCAILPAPAQASLFGDKTETPQKADNVYDYIRNNKNLSRFADMISSADLKDLFRDNSQPITVFAPSDDAIGDISSANMKRIKASRENLQSFVKYHVIVGSRVPFSSINGRKSSAAAANGESIMFDGTNAKEAKVNDGHLISSDAQVGNNVIHVISVALIPASLKEAPAEDKKKEDVKAPEVAPVPDVTPPISNTAAAPVSTSLSTKADAKSSKTKTLPVGTAAAVPATTAVPVAPVVEPTPADTQKSGGFNFFGHHFGG